MLTIARRTKIWLTILLLGSCGGCTSGESSKVPADLAPEPTKPSSKLGDSNAFQFSVVPSAALQEATFSSGHEGGHNTLLETVGGGVGCIDIDNDGLIDLVFPGGGAIDLPNRQIVGRPSFLFRNLGNWDFQNISPVADYDFEQLYSHGITAADYDNDGFVDLLFYGFQGLRLLRNQGDGTFVNAGQVQALFPQWTTAAAWCDLNADGLNDLYLGSYVNWNFDTHIVCRARNGQADICSPNSFKGMENCVLLNRGDGTFERMTDGLQANQLGKTLGVLAARFDLRPHLSIYVANDLIPNFLFSRKDGPSYVEHAIESGVAVDASGVANASMGLALLDFNLDRRFDIFVTNFENELMALYLNNGNHLFRHESRNAQLRFPDVPTVAFGVVAADFDCDGDEDVLFTSGHVDIYPASGTREQLPVLAENVAGTRFSRQVPDCEFFRTASVGRGLATADLDDDGDLDFVATNLLGHPPVAVENTYPGPKHWLKVKLIGTDSPRTPIGAIVEVTAGSRTMVRQLYGGGSYLSQNQQELHFGWPAPDSVDLTVHWPSGKVSKREHVKADQAMVIIE